MKTFPHEIVGPFTIPDVADRILDEFFQIAEELGIKGCLAFGLCLGFVREGGYINGDNDLDVIAIVSSIAEKDMLINCLGKHGFNQGTSFPPPCKNIHFYKDGILLDIFFHQSGEFYSSFDEVKHNGKAYPAPHPVEEYLSACYTNWKIPEDQDAHYCG